MQSCLETLTGVALFFAICPLQLHFIIFLHALTSFGNGSPDIFASLLSLMDSFKVPFVVLDPGHRHTPEDLHTKYVERVNDLGIDTIVTGPD